MLTIYLANNTVLAAVGSGKGHPCVKRVYSTFAPEGSLINGIVTDAVALRDGFAAFFKTNALPRRDVRLVLHSTQLVTRTVEVPLKLRRSRLPDFFDREFSAEGAAAEPVYSTLELGRDPATRRRRLLVTRAPRAYLDEMSAFFKSFGVTVTEIAPALSGVLTLLRRLPEAQGSCIVEIADGASLTSVLTVGGSYIYSTSARLYCEPDDPSYAHEMSEQVSSLMQFAQSQQLGAVHAVLLGGLEDTALSACSAEIALLRRDMLVQRAENKKTVRATGLAPEDFGRCLYPIGGLLLQEKRNETFSLYGASPKKAERADMLHRLKPVFLLGAALCAVVLIAAARAEILRERLAELTAYNTDPSVISSCEEYDALKTANEDLKRRFGEIQEDWTAIQSYPQANSALKTAIAACAGDLAEVSFTSYAAASGQLNLKTTAANVDDINRYIAILRTQQIFESVTYTGYAYNEPENNYSVNVVCTLSETAGK